MTTMFHLRAADDRDIGGILALYADNYRRLGAEPTYTAEDLLREWKAPHFSRDEHLRVADAAGTLVGFEELHLDRFATEQRASAFGYVSRTFRNRGVATSLLAWAVSAARARGACLLQASPIEASQRDDVGLIEDLGFTHLSSTFNMSRRDAGDAPEPVWPTGIVVTNELRGSALIDPWMAAHDAAFAGSPGFTAARRDHYEHQQGRSSFRPDLIWIAFRQREVAGYIQCSLDTAGSRPRGVIPQLGVSPNLRGQGLGRALLRQGVRGLIAEGASSISLQVDTTNRTALTLYEANGFVMRRETRRYLLDLEKSVSAYQRLGR